MVRLSNLQKDKPVIAFISKWFMEQKGGQSIAVSVEYASRMLTENSQRYWKCGKHIALQRHFGEITSNTLFIGLFWPLKMA
jgi:hypothetical protein